MNDGQTASSVIYSVSQLKLFDQCPLRYRYSYIDRLKSAFQSVESFVGLRVHDALEYLYLELREGMLLPVREILGHYRRRWEALWHRAIRFPGRGRTREWYRRYGEKCVRHFYNRYYPFREPGESIVDLEWSFELPLDSEARFKMRGHVDRLSRKDDDSFTVHDYKTSPYVPRLQTLVRDPQPGLYQLAVQSSFPEARKVQVSWHYLARQRELRPELSPEQLNQLQCRLIQKISLIEQATEFPARPSPACRSCEYNDRCPAFEEYNALQAAT